MFCPFCSEDIINFSDVIVDIYMSVYENIGIIFLVTNSKTLHSTKNQINSKSIGSVKFILLKMIERFLSISSQSYCLLAGKKKTTKKQEVRKLNTKP